MEEAPLYEVEQAAPEDATRARILDAVFSCAERYGLGRTTIADVAKEARLARQTVYRYFPTRHDLLAALVLREEERIIADVQEAVRPHDELKPALQAAFAATLRLFREHPLLDKVMTTEPQELLPFLTVEANPVLSLSMRLSEHVLATRAQHVTAALRHRAAETCARVFISYAISPPDEDNETVAAGLAELICSGLSGSHGREP
ncbi:MAG: TetR family transcriptional regulator [Actinomycetota bacterium]